MLRGRPAEKQPVNQPEHQICPCTAADQKQHRKIEVNDAIVKNIPTGSAKNESRNRSPPIPTAETATASRSFKNLRRFCQPNAANTITQESSSL